MKAKGRFAEVTVTKSKLGKIVRMEDRLFGGCRYALFDAKGNFVEEFTDFNEANRRLYGEPGKEHA